MKFVWCVLLVELHLWKHHPFCAAPVMRWGGGLMILPGESNFSDLLLPLARENIS